MEFSMCHLKAPRWDLIRGKADLSVKDGWGEMRDLLNLPKKRLGEVARSWNKGLLSSGGARRQHRGPCFLGYV